MTPTHTGTYIDFLSTGYSGQTNPLPKLKPCPFCGSVNLSLTQDDFGHWGVECHGYACHAYLSNAKWACERKEDAIAMWNRRAKE